MSEQPDDVLSAQDYNEIWYLVDYYEIGRAHV